MRQPCLVLVFGLLAGAPLAHADQDSGFFRSENSAVASGNERMAQKDVKGALAAYEEAAKALPNAPGVHFNRGLALMAQGEHDKAREALSLATQPPADKALRASAYYNLGNSFYKAADAAAKQEQHEQAEKLFREAVDAYKQSLRLGPGKADAAWNLQLAARRIREEEEKQEEQDKQQQENQEQDKQQQDKQQQEAQQPQARPSEAERALDALQDTEENLQQHRARQRALQDRRRPDKDW